jgi:hypothetical protein
MASASAKVQGLNWGAKDSFLAEERHKEVLEKLHGEGNTQNCPEK